MTKYQLSLSAEKLPRASTLRRGYPYAVVTVSGGPRDGDVLGETEALDTLDPRWSTILYVDTDTSIFMPITVSIYDRRHYDKNEIDDGGGVAATYERNDDKLMVEANFEVTTIHQSPVHTQYDIMKGGTIIRATVVESLQGPLTGTVKLRFRLLDVKNIEAGVLGLGRTDPFVEVQKRNFDPNAGDMNWIVTYRTEYVEDNLNPMFREFELSVEALCFGDPQWPLRLVLYDWQQNGKHRSMGVYETHLQDLMDKVSTGGNAHRDSAVKIIKANSEKTVALLIVLMAKRDE